MYDSLLVNILKRKESIFKTDYETYKAQLSEAVKSSRVLVIGAAGSIGAAFVRQVCGFPLKSLHLVDISENNLVEVVRDLRSSLVSLPDDFRTFAVAMGSPEFNMMLKAHEPYNYVVNFSAMKHVRSEKDPFSLMRMFDTNVNSFKKVLEQLRNGTTKKVFAVSSDKAVNPASLMGATKIFMEKVMRSLAHEIPFSTSRFANVAFSDGSLPYGFLRRMEKRQPLSAPSDVKRYFISHLEAGQLCLLSAFLGENSTVFFPKLDEDVHMLTFSEIAEMFLEDRGLQASAYESEDEAKKATLDWFPGRKEYPCYFFTSDTTGEKMVEEFYLQDDDVDFDSYENIGILHLPPFTEARQLQEALGAFETIRTSPSWKKQDMVEALKMIVPELEHEEKNKNLDQKM